MANVLTNLAADIYKAADTVGREVVGFIPASTINSDGVERVALNGTVRSHFTREATANNITPSMTTPEGDDQTVDNKTLTIDTAKGVQIPMTGEDIKHLNNGSGYETVYGDQIAQAMRTLSNLIETDLATAAYQGASRAVGTAGTTPFSSNFDLVAQARQILVDNGAPVTDGRTSLVLNTLAGTNLRNLAQLQKANEAGSTTMLRQGTLLDLQGVMLKESAQVQAHTKGTGTGYLINNGSGEAIGQTTLTLDTGSGTMIAGDVITHASDSTNAYVVNTALSGGDVIIGSPGLQIAAADDDAITIGNNFTGNVLFHQSALELAIRAPAVPEGGDEAVDAMLVQDPHSGLIFEIRVYRGYRKQMIEVASTWGVKAWKPDNITLVMG
jgi:hypothetical protein